MECQTKGVMYVEDNNDDVELMKCVLRKIVTHHSLNMDVFSNYEDAVKALDSIYDAYILDGNFPSRKDEIVEPLGIHLAKKIRERLGSYDRVFLVTDSIEIIERAKDAGIRAYRKDVWKEENQFLKDLKYVLGL